MLQVRIWGIHPGERHHDALAAGDLILVYLGAPERKFLGRTELGFAARDRTESEVLRYPGDSPEGVLRRSPPREQ